jgi:hypothetical protein
VELKQHFGAIRRFGNLPFACSDEPLNGDPNHDYVIRSFAESLTNDPNEDQCVVLSPPAPKPFVSATLYFRKGYGFCESIGQFNDDEYHNFAEALIEALGKPQKVPKPVSNGQDMERWVGNATTTVLARPGNGSADFLLVIDRSHCAPAKIHQLPF